MPDDRLNHVGLRLRIQLRDVRKRQVIDVIAASTVVVADVVTLLAVSYRMIPVVTRALRREADADGRFVRRSAVLQTTKNVHVRFDNVASAEQHSPRIYIHSCPLYIFVNNKKKNNNNIQATTPDLVLANHGHLLHRVQNVVEHLIRMLAVYLVRAFDAEVERRGGFVGERDRDAMIVADLGGLRIAGVRTIVPLAHERGEIV